MKKIVKTLSIALVIFMSFGFILMKQNRQSSIQLEQVSVEQNSDPLENGIIEETNDEQW